VEFGGVPRMRCGEFMLGGIVTGRHFIVVVRKDRIGSFRSTSCPYSLNSTWRYARLVIKRRRVRIV
jgi:hypothetical protein